MAKTFSFDLDMNKGERSDQIVYGRAGDKQSVNIVANLKLDGATWTPPSGDVNAYFECITGDNKSIRVKATLSDSTVSVSLPTDVYSFFGIVSNAYFRIEVGSADSPTYVESSASFSVYIFGSVDTAYTAFENSADLVNWRKLNATLNEVINQANASVNAAIKAFNDQLSDNKSRIDQAVSGASKVVDEADSLRRGGLTKPLAVSDGGTGAYNAAQARANLGISQEAASAKKLSTARTIVTNLASTNAASFDGTANVAPGVSGILPKENGGTGNSLGKAYSAYTATKLDLAVNITTNLASNKAASFDGSAAVTPGVSGVLGIANGGTGSTTAAGARSALGLGPLATTSTVPIANGGTGSTTAEGARSALGAAPLASPAFTGTPTAPTAAAGTTSTQLATTAFVANSIAAQVGDVVFKWSSDWNGVSAIGSAPREETTITVTKPWPRGLYLVCSGCRLRYKDGGAEENFRLYMAPKSGTATYVQAGAFITPSRPGSIASETWSDAFWLDSDFTGTVMLESVDWGSSPEIDLNHEWGFRDLSGKDVCRYVYVIRIV